jgi:alginate O-acetyltransferase complex protein AlgI
MLFNSHIFLLLFLPAALLLWWQPLPTRARLLLLAGASYVFYAYWDWRFAFLMLGTTVVDYLAGRAIYASQEQKTKQRWLVLSLVFNLGMLAFFKYYDFFAASVNGALHGLGAPNLAPILHVVLPIGISFYIFESVTYTIDIYRGIARPAETFYHYAVFISIFPKLIAGPIIRYTDVEEQYRNLKSSIDWEMMHRGIWFFVFGLAKKLLIADLIAAQINPMFAHYGQLGLVTGWAALLGYTFQIYFDFSAYSDMAVGLGYMLGFQFPQNFNRPYMATSISDFWNRWHMTLSRWLRDYLFIPLGGSRCSVLKTARNLVITMFLGGLWHGANWTFVLWGLYHGALLAGYHGWRTLRQRSGLRVADERLTTGDPRRGPNTQYPIPNTQYLSAHFLSPWASRAFLFLLVALGWVLFRSPNFSAAVLHLRALAGLRGIHGSFEGGNPEQLWLLIGACAAWTVLIPEMWDLRPAPRRRWAVALAAVMIVCIAHLGAESPFLYFQF